MNKLIINLLKILLPLLLFIEAKGLVIDFINKKSGNMSHILLIDDDEDILFSMSILLKRKGFAVTTTKDAHRIKYLVDMYKTDLIIMDINILEYDGRYICFDLKLNHDLKIPIILFSASQNSLETVKDYLADDFIAKPFSIDHVVTTINRHLINTELQITKLPL